MQPHDKWTDKAEEKFGPSRVWSELRDEMSTITGEDKVSIYSYYLLTLTDSQATKDDIKIGRAHV